MKLVKSGRGYYKDITDDIFDRITVIRKSDRRTTSRGYYWWCVCSCGNLNEFEVDGKDLRLKRVQSCGCFGKEKRLESLLIHGQSKTKLFKTYTGMIQRCYNPKSYAYKYYGGRGIKVCDRWLESFQNFKDDVGEKPVGHSLDRIDNEGNYSPDNFRWATRAQQMRNTRANVNITFNGKSQTLSDWVRELGLSSHEGLKWRIKHWGLERALTTYGPRTKRTSNLLRDSKLD